MGYTCDYCGEPIEDRDHARLDVYGGGHAWIHRDFHGEDCLEMVLNAVLGAAGDRPAKPPIAVPEMPDTVWRRTPADQQERWLLEALGDASLTIREATAQLNAQPGGPDFYVYYNMVDSLIKRMFRRGLLQRTPEPFGGRAGYRYRYSRPPGLDGPIAELERQFGEETA